MTQVILASNNAKKIAELNQLLEPKHWQVISQGQLNISEAEETASTFIENALIKARHASEIANLPALADDSGIVVDALQGAPGIYSARYAGVKASDQENLRKLLDALDQVPDADRTAHYHCSLVWVRHPNDPDPVICQGRWYGKILRSPQGAGGFGYDPIFWIDEEQCSAAELSAQRKGELSHRGVAMRQLFNSLIEEGIIGA